MSVGDFDPQRIIEALNRHRVRYVLVGGYAAQLYGAPRPTYDIDITPFTTRPRRPPDAAHDRSTRTTAGDGVTSGD